MKKEYISPEFALFLIELKDIVLSSPEFHSGGGYDGPGIDEPIIDEPDDSDAYIWH